MGNQIPFNNCIVYDVASNVLIYLQPIYRNAKEINDYLRQYIKYTSLRIIVRNTCNVLLHVKSLLHISLEI